eukprot:TRINITY_DN2761_c0_g5_i1.p1 TRINITY_DN2761_c0_g5~~TRINITY_DN2761_c0_g5_i1.p1  ORF type:complete len:480 (-),score=96.10 TRINITY_DN2761_c0_g5_i1:56-1495(-)
MAVNTALLIDSEEAKNVAVVHKTNQGYSGKDLYKLKQENPELFRGSPVSSGQSSVHVPAGFKKVPDNPGWLFSSQVGLYLKLETGKYYFRDAATDEIHPLHQGEDISSSLVVRGDASAVTGKSSADASRHVVINDLRRAASTLKLDLGHLDAPAAMFAIFDGRASAGGPAQAEAAAKGLHVKLLPRLAAFRGAWSDEKLQTALSESITTLAVDVGAEERGVAVAVALILGRRLFLAACRNTVCLLLDPEDEQQEDDLVGGESATPVTRCIDLAMHESSVGVVLTIDALRSGLPASRMRTLAWPHVASDRLKAACVALLGEAQKVGATPPLVASTLRAAWQQDSDGPAAKRARLAATLTKVRVRHILIRHSASQIAAGERVKKKATRTPAEAEELMLFIFGEIRRGDSSAFTAQCRGGSECDSAQKGGDLAGDLGWLAKDPAKNKRVPAAVTRAAFRLEVGELSDIVCSERGVHLLLRTA